MSNIFVIVLFLSIACAQATTEQPANQEVENRKAEDKKRLSKTMVEDSKGELTLHEAEKIHMTVMDGHLIFSVNLTSEILFMDRVLDVLVPTYLNSNLTGMNKAMFGTLTRRLARYRRRMRGFFKLIQRGEPKVRDARWLPLLSLGIGVANSAHLIVLHGEVHTLSKEVRDTIFRVNELTGAIAQNAEAVDNLVTIDSQLIQGLGEVSDHVHANRLSISALAVSILAVKDALELTMAIQTLARHRLPHHLLEPEVLEQAFRGFEEQVAKQGLKPVSESAAQLFMNEGSFMVTQDWTLHMVVPVPLKQEKDSTWTAFLPDRAVLKIEGTLWEFRSDQVLLEDQNDQHTEVPKTYLDHCQEMLGPEGKICPFVPPSTAKTCLKSLRRNETHVLCQRQLVLLPSDEPFTFRKFNGSFLNYSPSPDVGNIECPDLAYMVALHGLQVITIPLNCVIRIKFFTGFNYQDPVFRVKTEVKTEFTDLIRLMDLANAPIIDNVEELRNKAKELGKKTELTMDEVQQLMERPLKNQLHDLLPHGFLALTIIILGIITVAAVVVFVRWRKKQNRRQNQQIELDVRLNEATERRRRRERED